MWYSTESHTGTAVITVVESDNAIVVIPGANALVNETDVAQPALAKGDVLVSQFGIPSSTVYAFFSRAGSIGATTILNPAPAIDFDRSLLRLVGILVLNESELGFMTRQPLHESDPEFFFIRAARTLQMRDDQTICVTLGKRGALAFKFAEPPLIRPRRHCFPSHGRAAIAFRDRRSKSESERCSCRASFVRSPCL